MTVAATLATAPISVVHFEMVSLASLPANLLALPAVAPVMWLGMLSSALGQIPALPIEPLNWLSSLLIAYIAQVAQWLGTPDWAAREVSAPDPATLAVIGATLLLAGAFTARGLARRDRLRPAALRPRPSWAIAALPLLALLLPIPAATPTSGPARELRLTVFDVGQGDAILLDPRPGPPVLVDVGPPGTDLAAELADLGVERLAAVLVTHDHRDHAGGLSAVLASTPADVLLHAGAGRRLRAVASAGATRTRAVAAGDRIRVGSLSLRVLWPPADRPGARHLSAEDPNARSVVLLARWGSFDALLTGDAEAESAPFDPGPVEVIKVAHHGSEDPGLPALLDRADPRLAVISVGADNAYGHPHPVTSAALTAAGVPTARTDLDGDVEVTVTGGSFSVTG